MHHDPKVTLSSEDSKGIRDLVVQALKANPEVIKDVKVWQEFMSEVTYSTETLANKAYKAGYELGLKR